MSLLEKNDFYLVLVNYNRMKELKKNVINFMVLFDTNNQISIVYNNIFADE